MCLPLLSDEENRLQWSGTPVCLDPAFISFVHRASPNPHFIASQFRVGKFSHDAANIFVFEEVVARELHLIEIAHRVEEERIVAPAEEKTEVVCSRLSASLPDGDSSCLGHNFPVVAEPARLCVLKTARCRRLLPIFGICE